MSGSKNLQILAEIKKKHGDVIDLNKSPHTILDIIRNFHNALDEGGGGAPGSPPGTGGGHGSPGSPGPAPGGDSPGGGGGGAPNSPEPPPRGPDNRDLGITTVMNMLLDMKRDISKLDNKIDQHLKGATPARSNNA